jgi:hypothetical protein
MMQAKAAMDCASGTLDNECNSGRSTADGAYRQRDQPPERYCGVSKLGHLTLASNKSYIFTANAELSRHYCHCFWKWEAEGAGWFRD